MDTGKTLILVGLLLIVFGLMMTLGSKVPFLGKLPGDIFIKRDGFTFYFPIVTSILVSIILTLILNLFTRK